MCNGGAAAIEFSASRIQGDPATTRALVTTAERFCAPTFDRWGSDFGIAYGDGATAVLLGDDHQRPGVLELVAITTVADADLEGMENRRSLSAAGGRLAQSSARVSADAAEGRVEGVPQPVDHRCCSRRTVDQQGQVRGLFGQVEAEK